MTILSRLRAIAHLPSNLEAAIEMVRERAETWVEETNKAISNQRESKAWLSECESLRREVNAKSERIDALEDGRADDKETIKRINEHRTKLKRQYEEQLENVDKLCKRITELESELSTANDSIAGMTSGYEGELALRDETITHLESTITSLRSGVLPWRQIGEYESGKDALFIRDSGYAWVGGAPLTATHFQYLTNPHVIPTPKPAPKVVAWAVLREDSSIVYQFGHPLVWSIENPHAEGNATSFCETSEAIERKDRAVRLVILEDDNEPKEV